MDFFYRITVFIIIRVHFVKGFIVNSYQIIFMKVLSLINLRLDLLFFKDLTFFSENALNYLVGFSLSITTANEGKIKLLSYNRQSLICKFLLFMNKLGILFLTLLIFFFFIIYLNFHRLIILIIFILFHLNK